MIHEMKHDDSMALGAILHLKLSRPSMPCCDQVCQMLLVEFWSKSMLDLRQVQTSISLTGWEIQFHSINQLISTSQSRQDLDTYGALARWYAMVMRVVSFEMHPIRLTVLTQANQVVVQHQQ